MMQRYGFAGAGSDEEASLDAACNTFLEDATGIIAVGNVTATGSALSKQMLRPGTLILFDGGLEIWHRNAAIHGKSEGRLASLATGALERCTLARHEQLIEWCLFGQEESPLANVIIRPLDEVETDRVDAALTDWMLRERLPIATAGTTLATGANSARFSRVRDLAIGSVEATSEAASAAAGQVRERAKGTVDTLTLREFRDAIDAAMGQIVEVLAVHEAEISRLQQRERELSGQLAVLRESELPS